MAGTGWDPAGVDTEVTISPDGQTATRSGDSTYSAVRGLAGRSRGRRYFEITPSAATFASYCAAGFMSAGASLTQELGIGTPIAGGWMPEQGVFKYSYVSGAGMREDQDSVSAGVLGVLIDFDTKVCTIYRNGAIDWVEVMDIPNDTILFPAVSLYHDNAVTLQTVEPFQYPPEVTFMAWDIPDSALISRVAGLMKIEGAPVRRTLKAFSFERMTYQLDGFSITESKPLGQTLSGENGEYQIILRDGFPREVFVVAFDDYGEAFTPGLAVTPGYRLHPTEPNGHIYECDGSGVLPETEPTWLIDTENSQLIGTASFATFPFYRPEVNGPLMPEISMVDADPHWDKVVSLLHFDGDFVDQRGVSFSAFNNAEITAENVRFGSGALGLNGSAGTPGYLYADTTGDAYAFGTADFTIEYFQFLRSLTQISPIDFRSSVASAPRVILYNTARPIGTDLRLYVQGADRIIAPSGTLKVGQWQHFAISRVGGTTRMFVDGMQVGESWSDATNYTAAPLSIGRSLGTTNRYTDGNMEEIRITKGVGRYVEDFAPPVGPFPNFGPFSPRDIATDLWLDAADSGTITLTSGRVSSWADKSGKNRHATQDNASLRPTHDADMKAIVCDGTRQLLTPNFHMAEGAFFFVAESYGDNGFNQHLSRRQSLVSNGGYTALFRYQPARSGDDFIASFWGDTLVANMLTPSGVERSLSVFSSVYDLSSGVSISLQNGAEFASAATDGALSNTNEGWGIGGSNRYNQTERPLYGTLREVIFVSNPVGVEFREKIEGYLAWKWGLVDKLPANHPYKFVRP